MFITFLYHVQVALINAAIDRAKPGSRLYGLPHIADPSDNVVEVLIECMDWKLFSRLSQQTADGLADLHGCAVRLLDLLKRKLPDKSGEKNGWNFEKAHSILHKASEIVMWGNSESQTTPAARVLSTPTMTSSKQWLPATTTRMYSCASCAFMLAEDICSTTRHCYGSWTVMEALTRMVWIHLSLDQTTHMRVIAPCCGIAIST